jgi:hypothetical protein
MWVAVQCSDNTWYGSFNTAASPNWGFWPFDTTGTTWANAGTTVYAPAGPANSLWVYCPSGKTPIAASGGFGI